MYEHMTDIKVYIRKGKTDEQIEECRNELIDALGELNCWGFLIEIDGEQL